MLNYAILRRGVAGVVTSAPYLWNCEGTVGTQPTSNDTSDTLTYSGTDPVLVATPKFGTHAAGPSGTPASGDVSTALLSKNNISGLDTCLEGFFQFGGNAVSASGLTMFGVLASGLGMSIQYRADFGGPHTEIGIGFRNSGTLVETWGASAVSLSTYHHIALSRIGDIYTLWLDGVSEVTYDASTHPAGGTLFSTDYEVSLFSTTDTQVIADSLRLVKGCGVYDTGFTPPASALTAITSCPI